MYMMMMNRFYKKMLFETIISRCQNIDIPSLLNDDIYKWLIEKKYALPYDGGTKNSWANHLKINEELLLQVVGTSSL